MKNKQGAAKADDTVECPELKQGFLPRLVGYQIRRAHAHMRRNFLQASADLGLGFRPGQVSVMVLIAENPGLIQIELSRELDVDKATIVVLIDRLEKAGLVTRRRSTKDRRKQALYPTKAGIKMVAKLQEKTEAHEARYRSRFSDEEFSLFLDFLQRIYRDEED